MKKLQFIWRELMATFWFVPLLIISISIFLSLILLALDNHIEIPKNNWFRFYLATSPASARNILSTISAAMIGVAGTVFSITLVALTLASSQLGPRLIKNFMYVRLNQIVLGTYVSTYLYCLLILNAIKGAEYYTFIPSISILVAIVATIANIVLLIIFIHKIAISIQADNVISEISDLISKQVEVLFPEQIVDEPKNDKDIDVDKSVLSYSKKIAIKSSKAGYVQYIDSQILLKLVAANNSLIKLNLRPGSFLVEGEEIGTLYFNKDWDNEQINKLLSQFVFGKTKTYQQDIEFSIQQLVEIAARALSPGVNDPYTAIACIDNLTATLCRLAKSEFPSKYLVDEKNNLRIIAEVIDFQGVLNVSFNQIRQFSVGSPAVIIRLMEALITIFSFSKKESYKKAVIKHAEMVLRLGKETIKEQNDFNDLEERANKIL